MIKVWFEMIAPFGGTQVAFDVPPPRTHLPWVTWSLVQLHHILVVAIDSVLRFHGKGNSE